MMSLKQEDSNSSKADALSSLQKTGKSIDMEQIRQAMAKRSLDVKFDLQGTDYKPVENIGIGAYGVVCSAIHTKSGDRVAIKKIPCVFDAVTIAKRTYREIKILKHFKHDNVICIRDILKPKETVKDFKDIYVVFDLMESDLHRIIYSKQELSEEHVRYFLYQILRGLKYIHSANVIHRDLKPSNLLVNEDCHLRIGDFGMARGISYTPNEPSYYMTQYVATRWYRAPEILLSMLEYGTAVDMWSVGCIFAEMLGRKHLFPGKDYLTQVKLILAVLGTPSDRVMENCQNDILKRIIKSFGKKKAVEWNKIFPKASKKSIDLLSKMLVLDPSDRITPEKALSHRLLNNYHDPDDEPICVPVFNFDFEKEDMDKKRLRSVIMEEVMCFHEPKPANPTLSFSAFLRPVSKDDDLLTKSDLLQATTSSICEGEGEKIEFASVVEAHSPEEKRISSHSPHQEPQSSQPTLSLSQASTLSPSRKAAVSVDTSPQGLALPADDVEMLSAQSTMDVQELGLEDKLKETTMGQTAQDQAKGSEKKMVSLGNTISEDTKALVKQALLNATQRRQRAESQCEDNKDRPVTALQRQKEREEKRRKKRERALEKGKKGKSKKGQPDQTQFLSNEDVEMLRRWTSMQKPGTANTNTQQSSPPRSESNNSVHGNYNSNCTKGSITFTSGGGLVRLSQNLDQDNVTNNQSKNDANFPVIPQQGGGASKHRQIFSKAGPSAPVSVTLGTSLQFSSTQNGTGATVLIPSAQMGEFGQANFIPVIAIPSTTNPGKMEIKRIFRQQHQPSKQSQSQQGEKISRSQQHARGNQSSSETTRNLLQAVLKERSQGVAEQQYSNTSSAVQPNASTTSRKSSQNGIVSDALTIKQEPTFSQVFNEATATEGNNSNSFLSSSTPFPISSQTTCPPVNPLVSRLGNNLQSGQGISQENNSTGLDANHTSFIDLLDQLKDSPTKAEAPSEDPTVVQFAFSHDPGASSTGLSFESHISGPLNTGENNVNVGACSQGVPPVLRRHNSTMDYPQYQQRPSLPHRSSLPFEALRDTVSMLGQHDQTKQALVKGISFIGNNVNPTGLQSEDSCSFKNVMDNSGQDDLGRSGSPAIPFAQYSNSNSYMPSDQRHVTTFNQNFSATSEFNHQQKQTTHINFPQSSSPNVYQSVPISKYSDKVHVKEEGPLNSIQLQSHGTHPHHQVHSHHLHQTQLNPSLFQHHHPQQPTLYHDQHQYQQHQAQIFNMYNNSSGFSNIPMQSSAALSHSIAQRQQMTGQAQTYNYQPYASQVQPQLMTQQNQHRSDLNSQPSTSGDPGTRSPGLTIDCSKEGSNTGGASTVSSTVTTTSIPNAARGSVTNQRQAEVIANLSKQLSKAEVVDIFPPALALTPRGTGAGYGVGMDLDSMLTDAQDVASHRGENSPLSSSLLADWLDLSSNISQADLEALEREMALQSPMNVSYGDFGL